MNKTKKVLHLIGKIPYRLIKPIALLASVIAIKMNSRAYRTTQTNIALCFPELTTDEQKQLCKKSLIATVQVVLETAHTWTKPRSWAVQQFISSDNETLLQQALHNGKATLLLSPHLGNWEILGAYLAAQKPITIMYLPPENEEAHQLIVSSRNNIGITLAPANRKGVLSVFKAAKNAEFIGILPDQEPDIDSGEFAPFFNQPALTITLVHKLLQKCECTVVMAYAKRVDGGFQAVFREPEQGIYSEDTNTSLEALNRSIEKLVMECPEQYQWEYKRFKAHPSGKKNVRYKKHT